MANVKELTKKCPKCKTEHGACISKRVDKKHNGGVERLIYQCAKCKAQLHYQNNTLVECK